jgi:hypothetical protein
VSVVDTYIRGEENKIRKRENKRKREIERAKERE